MLAEAKYHWRFSVLTRVYDIRRCGHFLDKLSRHPPAVFFDSQSAECVRDAIVVVEPEIVLHSWS